ncbi:hypothetical protein DTO164E3_472 [Paecilomyces variotii]|nr:hypothetical protein DTO032I3_1804 [Paecilomyces variotii]KAJ9207198.1 hypothetical protein DTO164E3_472 [Paecilomyces variotii]KAJ9240328.1 hypothetical protein DTO169E5_4116 [Paecilomyces variotii]KAJ9281034.1 hypothetical protein DTO021D3_2088 [Paecilomyces variotii]KAJ9345407.1 hypothetical protein DTO027B6_1938 [Paecilomyces variotii]
MNASHAKGKTVIDLTVEAMSRHDARTGCLNFVGYTTILFRDAVSHTRDPSSHKLYTSGEVKHVELMFLDHYKPAYTTNLKLCEYCGLISSGTVLAADNVLIPWNSPHLEYRRAKQSGTEPTRATTTKGSRNAQEINTRTSRNNSSLSSISPGFPISSTQPPSTTVSSQLASPMVSKSRNVSA